MDLPDNKCDPAEHCRFDQEEPPLYPIWRTAMEELRKAGIAV
jgi:hypothetical protein